MAERLHWIRGHGMRNWHLEPCAGATDARVVFRTGSALCGYEYSEHTLRHTASVPKHTCRACMARMIEAAESEAAQP